jgi:hypothetical protein
MDLREGESQAPAHMPREPVAEITRGNATPGPQRPGVGLLGT